MPIRVLYCCSQECSHIRSLHITSNIVVLSKYSGWPIRCPLFLFNGLLGLIWCHMTIRVLYRCSQECSHIRSLHAISNIVVLTKYSGWPIRCPLFLFNNLLGVVPNTWSDQPGGRSSGVWQSQQINFIMCINWQLIYAWYDADARCARDMHVLYRTLVHYTPSMNSVFITSYPRYSTRPIIVYNQGLLFKTCRSSINTIFCMCGEGEYGYKKGEEINK